MKIEIPIEVDTKDIETILKWASNVKNPNESDRQTRLLFEVLLNDMKRQDKEDEED